VIAVVPRPHPVIVIVAVIGGKSGALLEHSSRVHPSDAEDVVETRECANTRVHELERNPRASTSKG